MPMPFIPVAIALKQELAANLPAPIKVRHHRHRESTSDELPCVAIRIMSNDPSDQGRETTASGLPEQVMELAVDIVIDMDLAAEVDAPGDDDSEDPTGYGGPAAIMAQILDILFPGIDDGDTNTLGGTTWLIRYDGTAPNEAEAEPDYARMEERLVLSYRVRADRPTELLLGS